MTMTISMTEMLATGLAKHELSTDELDTITAGATIMSGVPNSMTTTFQRGSTLPPLRWSGGSPNSAIHMAAF
jgi:hypothetical protein